MDKNVLIHVRGLQMMEPDDDPGNPLRSWCPASIISGTETIISDTRRSGGEFRAYGELHKNIPTGMEVRKKGLVNMHMVFEPGKKNMTYYTTPYGTLQLGIAATGMDLKETEDGIDMTVDYSLDMNEQHVADCCLSVRAQSADSSDFVL